MRIFVILPLKLSTFVDCFNYLTVLIAHYYTNLYFLLGWVKQPSACCAAASVAGSWNCLANLGRNDRDLGALSHDDVLDVYREIFLELIKKKKASFERLSGTKFMPLLALIEG